MLVSRVWLPDSGPKSTTTNYSEGKVGSHGVSFQDFRTISDASSPCVTCSRLNDAMKDDLAKSMQACMKSL